MTQCFMSCEGTLQQNALISYNTVVIFLLIYNLSTIYYYYYFEQNFLCQTSLELEKLKLSIEKKDAENERLKQGKELATSAIRDLRETVAKQAAEIERVKNAADIYKGKADGFKYELAEKDREIARLKSQAEGIDDIRSALERYKAGKEYNDSYSDAEVYMKY